MNKISPCLWFDGQAEEAVALYLSVFKNSKQLRVMRYTENFPAHLVGKVLTIEFELFGQTYVALNGGPQNKFTPALSLSVTCDSQAEIDAYWDALLADGGAPVQCGWLTDKFGLSWQIFPGILPDLLRDPDPAKAQRVMQAMMQMVKIDIAAIEHAAAGA